jgi:phosphoglycerate kinase
MRTLKDLPDITGKRVILRCDLNVPLDGEKITDDGRIIASIPTIQALLEKGAKVIVLSHLGRPDGAFVSKYSLTPVAKRLGELLGIAVPFATDTIGESAKAAVEVLEDGQVLVLENLRFNADETAKSDDERQSFAQSLAEFGDVVVSDGFGVVHRKQASVYDLENLLPSYAGLLIERELNVLQGLTTDPERPYSVVLGGSKVSDKLGVIDHLLPRVDSILIGGGMVFTFLAALGYKVGSSLLEVDQIETCKGYLAKAEELGVKVILPTDIVVAAKFSSDAEFLVTAANAIEETAFGSTGLGLDIGPESAQLFAQVISSSKTVFWNGPMGVFEFENFANGTRVVAEALSKVEGLSVVGGGDSAAAVRALGFPDEYFSHISTGGGASLEFLEGKAMPGLEVLQ